jgi:hypothetical protein
VRGGILFIIGGIYWKSWGCRLKDGVKVKVKDGGGDGYILRRLNIDSYEVWLETDDRMAVLSPEEFVEVNDD